MNKLKLLKEFENQFSDFEIHPDLIIDLISIINKSGNEIDFLNKLKKRLNLLKTYSYNTHILTTNQFERLTGVINMYSMHIQGKNYNVRIIYSFLKNGTVLLHGFYEQEDKNITDYSSAIPIAKKRFKDMEEKKYE